MAVLEGDEILLVWLRRRRDSPMDVQLVDGGAIRRRCRFSLQNLRRACRACVSCRSYDSTDVSVQDVPAVELEQWPQHAELFCAGGACSVHYRTIRRERQVHGEGWAGL